MIEPITASEITTGFSDMAAAFRKQFRPLVPRIISDICERRGVLVDDVKSPNRLRPVAWARQDCMLEIRERTNLSLPQIGRVFGRDHTTVKFGIERAKMRRELSREAQ